MPDVIGLGSVRLARRAAGYFTDSIGGHSLSGWGRHDGHEPPQTAAAQEGGEEMTTDWRARGRVTRALKTGVLIRPKACEQCKREATKLQAHPLLHHCGCS